MVKFLALYAFAFLVGIAIINVYLFLLARVLQQGVIAGMIFAIVWTVLWITFAMGAGIYLHARIPYALGIGIGLVLALTYTVDLI